MLRFFSEFSIKRRPEYWYVNEGLANRSMSVTLLLSQSIYQVRENVWQPKVRQINRPFTSDIYCLVVLTFTKAHPTLACLLSLNSITWLTHLLKLWLVTVIWSQYCINRRSWTYWVPRPCLNASRSHNFIGKIPSPFLLFSW